MEIDMKVIGFMEKELDGENIFMQTVVDMKEKF
jgi:hypothetical protein